MATKTPQTPEKKLQKIVQKIVNAIEKTNLCCLLDDYECEIENFTEAKNGKKYKILDQALELARCIASQGEGLSQVFADIDTAINDDELTPDEDKPGCKCPHCGCDHSDLF